MRRKPLCQPGMVAASERKPGQNAASIAGEQSPGRQRQRREPGKPTWRCLNRLSLSSAWLAPLNRGSLNSAHIHGTDVPVEEPSTASGRDSCTAANGRRTGLSVGQPTTSGYLASLGADSKPHFMDPGKLRMPSFIDSLTFWHISIRWSKL